MQLKQAIPFLGGLNRDDDPRFLPEGDYPYLRNARTGSPDEQQDEGLVVSMKSVVQRAKTYAYSSTGGTYHLGVAVDKENGKSYVMLWDGPTQDFIIEEFNSATDTYDKILDVSGSDWNIDHSTKFINPAVINGNLILTDNDNHPLMINIERARKSLDTGVGYGDGNKPTMWNTGNFLAGNFVFYIDKFYIALRPTTNDIPPDNPLDWEYLCTIEEAYASMDLSVFLFESKPPLKNAPVTASPSDNLATEFINFCCNSSSISEAEAGIVS